MKIYHNLTFFPIFLSLWLCKHSVNGEEFILLCYFYLTIVIIICAIFILKRNGAIYMLMHGNLSKFAMFANFNFHRDHVNLPLMRKIYFTLLFLTIFTFTRDGAICMLIMKIYHIFLFLPIFLFIGIVWAFR